MMSQLDASAGTRFRLETLTRTVPNPPCRSWLLTIIEFRLTNCSQRGHRPVAVIDPVTKANRSTGNSHSALPIFLRELVNSSTSVPPQQLNRRTIDTVGHARPFTKNIIAIEREMRSTS